MLKKIVFTLFIFVMISPILVHASIGSLVKVGNKYYETLEEAIANAGPNDTVTLISDVKLKDTLQINKTVNINLNGNDITAPSKVFEVQGGVLNLTGKGTIKETEPNYGAIMIKGSTDPNDEDYSIVNVGKDVTLEGWSGIFITHDNSKSYGVVVNLEGSINAVDDTSGGEGIGVYVNGNIKEKNNSPIVNIKDGADITSTGNGLYIAGESTFNIGASNISGIESGIGIKSGTLNIKGATVMGTGPDATPTEGYNNGIKASGTALQIESNDGYAGNMNINIENGTFKSKNSNVVYEYIGKGNTTQVDSINISNGTFTSSSNKDVFLLSNSFENNHKSFITGGKYSSNPNLYLESGYTTTKDDGLYKVIKSTFIAVNKEDAISSSSNLGKTIIITIVTIISILVIYLNRTKILKFLRK